MERTRRRKQHQLEEVQRSLPFYNRPFVKHYMAIFLVLLASVCLSLNSVFIKFLRYMTAAELAFTRNVFMLSMVLPLVTFLSFKDIFCKEKLKFFICRGVFGFADLYLLYLALILMPITDVSVLKSTVPVWVVILSRIILKENLDLLNSLSILLTMMGLLFMSRVLTFIGSTPSEKFQDSNYWYGFACSLGSAFLQSITYIILRKLKDTNESITVFYNSSIGTICFGACVLISRNVILPSCGIDGVYVLLLGVLSFLGHVLMTKAFRLEKAGAVSSVKTSSQVGLSFLFQAMFLTDTVDVWSILAAVCVFVSLWLSALRKYCQQKRRQSEKGKLEDYELDGLEETKV